MTTDTEDCEENLEAAKQDLEACEENLEAAQQETQQLRQAIDTRAPIEQAKGMLMLLLNCDDDFAFELLVKVSQTTHVKLATVASNLCEALAVENVAPPEFTAAFQQLSSPKVSADS